MPVGKIWCPLCHRRATFEILKVAHQDHEADLLFIPGIEINDAEQVLLCFKDFFSDLEVLVIVN